MSAYTFNDLCGFGWNKNLMIARCSSGDDSPSSSSPSNDDNSSSAKTNQDRINEIYAANDDPWGTDGAELNALTQDRDATYNPAPVSNITNNVSNENTSSNAGTNTARMDIANSITKDDGMTYIDGKLYNEDDNTLVTETTSWQNLADFVTPSDGTTYNQGQLVDGNDNTIRMDIANSITPKDDMEYINGQLYNADGSLVTENTSYQDLTNALTLFDGKSYEDGQLVVNNDTPPPVETDSDPSVVDTGVTTTTNTDTTTNTGTDTATNTDTTTNTGTDTATNTDTTDYTDLVDALTSITGGGDATNVTSLPDDYLTEEDLERYLANLDLGSNAYDPAAFLNAYGFALNGTQNNLIANTSPTSGVYTRRAVKDRETGEIRYVNVPVGKGAIDGNNGQTKFRLDRRNGFASMV